MLCLTSDIKETSLHVFKARKGFSPKGAAWWNRECDQAAMRVREAQDQDACKEANKALRRTVAAAKRVWANDLLHNATPEKLWTAAKWRFGRKQRLIPALITTTGLTDQPDRMTMALKSRFFKQATGEVPPVFPDDPPPHDTRPIEPISISEISDALSPTSNKSAPGPSGHNYKLVKWVFDANPA